MGVGTNDERWADGGGTGVDTSGADAPAFHFVGGSLALDLVNTEVVVRGKPLDLLRTEEDLAAWWAAARAHHLEMLPPETRPREGSLALAAVKDLRAAVRGIAEAVAAGHLPVDRDLDRLNRVLRAGFPALEIAADGRLRAAFRCRAEDAPALAVAVARAALDLVTGRDPARLRRCGNERCVLLFYDVSKGATRRWCSTGCMHRARSAERYRARKRAALEKGSEARS